MSKNTDLGNLVNGLFVDSSRNVGIGTTSPANALVVDRGNATASYLQFTAGTTTGVLATDGFEVGIDASGNGIISQQENLPLMIYTNAAERMRILSNGVVNINRILALTAGTYQSQRLVVTGGIGINSDPADGVSRLSLIGDSSSGDGIIDWGGNGNFNLRFTNNGSERLRIASDGNIYNQFGGNRRWGMDLDTTGTYFYGLASNSNARQTRIICAAPDDNRGISFETGSSFSGASQKMLITSVGNVLINRTTLSAASLSANGTLQVNNEFISTGSNAGLFWENRSGGVTVTSNWYGWYTLGGVIYLYNGGANIASVNSSTGTYTALSDVNKKKDFEQSNIGLNEVLQLKPTLYRMKTDNDSSSKELGFIAQEVKELIPQAYSETGEGDDKFIGLNQMPLIAALTKAIQELKAEIEILKQK
jgi:hypothetical protein